MKEQNLNESQSSSTVCLETADFYQEFFNFFSKEHNLILTIQEMDEIRHECRKLENRSDGNK